MLQPFEIHEPDSIAEASRLLGLHGDEAVVYAGGTELIPIMKAGLAHFRHLVNIKTIPGLSVITASDATCVIGALATHEQIARSTTLRARAPVLSEVASHVANLRVRAVGTLGGNLCFAEPHSDPAVALIALAAIVVLARDGAERRVPADQFFRGILESARTHEEILVRVEVPTVAPDTGAAYHRFALHERPTAGVAVALTLQGGLIRAARVAAGSIGPMPVRVPEVETALAGQPPESRVLNAAAVLTGRSVEVLDDVYGSVAYKRHIVTILAGRALRQAAARAAGIAA